MREFHSTSTVTSRQLHLSHCVGRTGCLNGRGGFQHKRVIIAVRGKKVKNSQFSLIRPGGTAKLACPDSQIRGFLRASAGSQFERKNGRVSLDLGRGCGYSGSDDCTVWAVNRGAKSTLPASIAIARRLPPTLFVAVPLNLTFKRTVSLLAKTPCVFSRGVCQGADIESDPARKETACSPRRAAGLRQGCRRFDRIEEGSTALARQMM